MAGAATASGNGGRRDGGRCDGGRQYSCARRAAQWWMPIPMQLAGRVTMDGIGTSDTAVQTRLR